MKIAIATNDRKNIAQRTGRAKEFAVFHLDSQGNITKEEYRINEHAKHHHEEESHSRGMRHRQGHGKGHGHHHGEHRHDEVVELFKDVDVLLYKALGKYMRKDMEEAKIPIARAHGEDLKEIIINYLKN